MESRKSHQNNKNTVSPVARAIGAPLGSITAFALALPFETGTTRWQITNQPMTSMNSKTFYKMFLNTEYKSLWHVPKDSLSLFNGLTAGVQYKAFQGGLRYFLQPVMKQSIQSNTAISAFFNHRLSEQSSKSLLSAVAGSAVGLVEVALLPLDTIKKMCMVSEKRVKLSDMYKLLINENVRLYRGWKWTAARNALGGFFQFGAYEAVMRFGFQLNDTSQATKTQIAIAAAAGGVAMTALTNPFEVSKVRAQVQQSAKDVKGFSYLFKGTTLKVLTKSPSVTLALYFSEVYSRWLNTLNMDSFSTPKPIKSTIQLFQPSAKTEKQEDEDASLTAINSQKK